MLYSPHTLHKKEMALSHDEDGFVNGVGSSDWELISECRCDDDGVTEIMDDKGRMFMASYHIVLPSDADVSPGDYVMVPEKGCEGYVKRMKRLNYLDYAEIWI